MNTTMDVLAVMDAACCVLAIDKKADPQKQLEQARAAVAELIHVAGEESTETEYAETVDGAANLTAHDWIARAIETLREADDGEDSVIGDVLDDLVRAQSRIRAAIARVQGGVA
jgi:hypothetical protein